MTILNSFQQDTIVRGLQIAQFLHDNDTLFYDLKILYDSVGTGIKDILDAMPDNGQSALDELGALNGMTVAELNDIMYVVTALVEPIITAARAQLANVIKANV